MCKKDNQKKDKRHHHQHRHHHHHHCCHQIAKNGETGGGEHDNSCRWQNGSSGRADIAQYHIYHIFDDTNTNAPLPCNVVYDNTNTKPALTKITTT